MYQPDADLPAFVRGDPDVRPAKSIIFRTVLLESTDINRDQRTVLADHCWSMSCDEAVIGSEADRQNAAAQQEDDEEEEEDLEVELRYDAVTHYALAEKVSTIIDKLKSLPAPTDEEMKQLTKVKD